MSKMIPKQLKKAVMKCLVENGLGPLSASNISERIEADPELPASMKRPPRQFTYTMKKLAREIGLVETHVLSTNGMSRHGTQRYRVGYALPEQVTLAEAVEAAGVVEKPPEYDSRMVTVRLRKDDITALKNDYDEDMTIEEVLENLLVDLAKLERDRMNSNDSN